MSRNGNFCYDNAPMESFWGLFNNELVHHRRFNARADATQAITLPLRLSPNSAKDWPHESVGVDY